MPSNEKPKLSEAIRELEAKATKGPWVDTGSVIVRDLPDFDRPHIGTAKNCDRPLIVFLRNHALELADAWDENEQLRQAIAEQSKRFADEAEESQRLKARLEKAEALLRDIPHVYIDMANEAPNLKRRHDAYFAGRKAND